MLTTPAIAANTAPMCGIVILPGSHLLAQRSFKFGINNAN